MYCPYCGKQIADNAKFCTECGASVVADQTTDEPEYVEAEVINEPSATYGQASFSTSETLYSREANSGLFLAAFVLNIVSTVSLAVFIIPLAWCIPMTIRSYNIYKGKKPNTVAFGVCTLIFLNLISGILMLVANPDE